jgi:hypothetical protein
MAHKVQLARKVLPVLMEHKEQRVRKALQVLPDYKVLPVHKAQQDFYRVVLRPVILLIGMAAIG